MNDPHRDPARPDPQRHERKRHYLPLTGDVRSAIGLPPGQRQPKFLTAPPEPSFRNSPELRRIWLFGIGLVALVVITLLVAPSANSPAPQPAAPAEANEPPTQRIVDGSLLDVRDGGDFCETDSYLETVRLLSDYDAQEFHRRTTKTLDWERTMANPAAARGEFVRHRGLLGWLTTVKLKSAAAGDRDVYRCFLADADVSEPVVVDLVAPPTVRPQARRDVVDVEGVFYRTVDVEGRDGKVRTVPYLIGRNLSLYEPPRRGFTGWQQWAVFGGVVAAAVVIAIIVMRREPAGRRHDAALLRKPGVGIRELFEMRLREAGVTPPRPPGSPPSSEDR